MTSSAGEIPLVYSCPYPVLAASISEDVAPPSCEEVVVSLLPAKLPLAVYCYDEPLKKKYHGNLIELTEERQVIEVKEATTLEGVKLELDAILLTIGINTDEDKKLRCDHNVKECRDGWYQWKRGDNHLPIITLLPNFT